MSSATKGMPPADRRGRIALVDLVEHPTPEARRTFADEMESALARAGGRVAWAGRVDQQLIGAGAEHYSEVWVSEFSTREACARALAARGEPDAERAARSFVATPWPTPVRGVIRAVFGLRARLGGGPPPVDPAREPWPPFEAVELGTPEFGPNRAQFAALQQANSSDPVVMVNFLHFRERAAYPADGLDPSALRPKMAPGAADVSGRAAYGRYSANTIKLVGRMGGRLRWTGFRAEPLGDGSAPAWSQIALMQYPTRAHFIGMVRDAAYQAGTPHRDAGLERTELLACTSHAGFR